MTSPSPSSELAAHGGRYAAGRLVQLAIAVALLPVYAHFLGDGGFGAVALLWSLATLFQAVVGQGQPDALFRLSFDAAGAEERATLRGTVFFYLLASVAVATAVLWWVGDALLERVAPGVGFLPLGAFVIAAAALALFGALYERALQVDRRSGVFLRFTVLRSVVSALLVGVLLVALGRGVRGRLEADVLTAGAAALVAAVGLGVLRRPAWSFGVLKRCLAFGLPLVPHAAALWANDLLDRVVLSAELGLAATGVYALGYQLADVTRHLAIGLTQAYGAAYVSGTKAREQRIATGDPAAAQTERLATTRAGLRLVAAVAVAALCLTAFAREAFVLATPVAFHDAWIVVAPVALAGVFHAVGGVVGQPLTYDLKAVRRLAPISVAGAALNLGGNLLLVPRFGLLGAATATVASFGLMALLTAVSAGRVARQPWEKGRWAGTLGLATAGLGALWALDAAIDSGALRIGVKTVALCAAVWAVGRAGGFTPAGARALIVDLLGRGQVYTPPLGTEEEPDS